MRFPSGPPRQGPQPQAQPPGAAPRRPFPARTPALPRSAASLAGSTSRKGQETLIYREDDETRWQALLQLQPRVRDHFATIGLEVLLDEGEGYSYLRQRLATADDDEGLPRLVPRRPLSYPVSLLLALLRKRLTELDNAGTDTRLVLSRDELVEMYRVFFPETANEAGQLDRFDSHLSKVEAMGFLRRYGKKDEDKYEVRRILKAFVDGQWLGRLAEQLEQYRAHATGAADVEEGA